MKVLSHNFNADCLSYSPAFCARNKDIKEADRIVRKTKQNFPMTSCTYAGSFYNCAKKGSKNVDRAYDILLKVKQKISLMRKESNYAGRLSNYVYYDTKYGFDLDKILENKTGNCAENSKAALATLCANGFYNSSRVSLFYEIQFINKKTKKEEYKSREDLDHNFVITDLNKRKKKDIVVDPWLGFADFECGAFAKFRQIYDDELDTYEEMHKKLFLVKKLEKGEDYNPDDYEMRAHFVFSETESVTNIKDKKALGAYVARRYPSVLLDVSG